MVVALGLSLIMPMMMGFLLRQQLLRWETELELLQWQTVEHYKDVRVSCLQYTFVMGPGLFRGCLVPKTFFKFLGLFSI